MMTEPTPPPKDKDEDDLHNLAEVAYIHGKSGKKSADDTPIDIDPKGAEQYFRPLGHYREQFFFITVRGRQVLHFPVSKLTIKAVLFMLAPLQWWEREFPSQAGFKGAAVDMAVNWVIAGCFSRGVFRMDRLRGRGAWWDDGRSVIHAGDHLLVDGARVEMNEIESRYVYEALPALSVEIEHPATDEESAKLLAICDMLHWENKLHGKLLAGWAVTALACGALEWRPHCMTTGPSGCGKSWVAKHIVQRVLGEFLLAAKGETTEAGLRQALQHDALPVTFDEAEGDDQRTAQQMERVLGLMRQSSTEARGKILKGGSDGTGQSYTIRSAFHLFAIRVPLQQTADENRVTVLTLRRNNVDQREQFATKISPLAAELDNDDWAARVRARVFLNIDVLRHNASVFSQAFSQEFDARTGDQYGPLLAGAWLLGSTKRISLERATAKVKSFDHLLGEARAVQAETDEDKLIATMMAQQVDVKGDKTRLKMAVGELIEICAGQRTGDVWPNEAAEALQRHGIKPHGTRLFVANKHDGLRKLLEKTPWGVGWSHILRRIEDAQACSNSRRFGGVSSRCVDIPLSVFLAGGGDDV